MLELPARIRTTGCKDDAWLWPFASFRVRAKIRSHSGQRSLNGRQHQLARSRIVPFPPPALPGFSGTTNLSAAPRRPACPSRASGWSLLTTPWGFPCCARFPCVHAVATTQAQRLGHCFAHLLPAVSAFPERVVGSACASSFSRLPRRFAVGTAIADRPPHRSGLAQLRHPAPTLGV